MQIVRKFTAKCKGVKHNIELQQQRISYINQENKINIHYIQKYLRIESLNQLFLQTKFYRQASYCLWSDMKMDEKCFKIICFHLREQIKMFLVHVSLPPLDYTFYNVEISQYG